MAHSMYMSLVLIHDAYSVSPSAALHREINRFLWVSQQFASQPCALGLHVSCYVVQGT